MPELELGLGLFPTEPPRRIVEVVQEAERLGYSHAWLGDSQLIWRELYVNLGAAGLATSRVRLGQGVTNPVTRDPTVTASAVATLGELTGDRVDIGIGCGDSSVETMGRAPATLRRLEESIGTIRRLLAGERVETGRGEVRLSWAEPRHVPVFVAASGPRILRLAGRVADGVIVLTGVAPEYVRSAMRCVEDGAGAAGRDLAAEGFRYVCWAPGSIGRDGAAAREHVKSHVARVLKRRLPFELEETERAAVTEIRERYQYYQHMAVGSVQAAAVPDRLVPRFALAGTPEECREQVELLAETGIHQVALVPHSPDAAERLSVVRAFGREVMRRS